MKILVIDDTKKHLNAALQTLTGHDVTTCSSHDEALKLLEEQYDKEKTDVLRERYHADEISYDEYRNEMKKCKLPYWDAVLCDLLMPAGSHTQGTRGMKYVGQEMPVGWSLALMAVEKGAKMVAVVTDLDHHSHPASAMLDSIRGHIFAIDGAKMMMTNHVGMVGINGTECTCTACRGTGKKSRSDGSTYECYHCGGSGKDFAEKGKDWGKILDQILSKEAEKE